MNDLSPNKHVGEDLRVVVIDTLSELLKLENAWKGLEKRDPEATFFLSWDWLVQAFRDNPFRWSVLAAYARGAEDLLIGLLPLKYGTRWSASRQVFQTEIEAGGRLLFSEYTGFLCEPAKEASVMAALARALHAMPWTKLSLRYVAQKRRAEVFCAALEGLGYPVDWKEYRINNGETNNLICPRVPLADDFETYLNDRVSANTRQRYRRFKRRHFTKGSYRFTHADAESFDRDIGILMGFWRQNWSETKGRSQANKVAANFEKVLRSALNTEALFLPVLWRGDTPIAALGHVMDPANGVMHFIIAGRDTTAEEPFIGAALHFHSIECAIMLGCQAYDFGHGDEPYKFSYGAEETELAYFSITRPDPDQDKVFDSLCIGGALRQVERLIKAGKSDAAARACRQLSQLFR
jgi:CelD/BcsL family acetyltransferase involved in cellulose biosynthesis